MLVQTEKRLYSPEEYLALEETAEFKNEYHDGEIIPMTGGTTNHNRIAGNFYKKFPLKINEQSYEIFIGDVRLSIPAFNRYVYPDIMVIEGQPIYEGTGKSTVTNPCLIVEVLSPSTRNYDRGDKFDYYRSIPTFREYVLIDQSRSHVEQYAKTSETQWLFTEYNSENATLALTSIEFQVIINELYERVDFSEELSENENR